MSKTSVWTRLRSSFVALGLVAGAAAAAHADPITDPSQTVLGYDTSKSYIETTGVTGDASALKITPVAGGTFLDPSYLSLGAFQASPLSAGQAVTFNNTPFHFLFSATSINDSKKIVPNETPIDLGGVLNGTLGGTNQSSLTATFGKKDAAGAFHPYLPGDTFTFQTGLYKNTLKLPNNPLAIVPSTSNGGMTTAQAYLSNVSVGAPVPEPSTVVLFAATAVGLGFRHRLRKGRALAG